MATSIIDIDVNDKSFQQFTKLWQQYQQGLKQTPTAWKNIVKSQAESLKSFKEMVAEQALAMQQAKMQAEAQKVANRLLRSNADIWRDIRRNAAGAALTVKDMTLDLVKWSGVIGAISGLLGAGGLFGVTRLAQNVAGGRRTALGVGATYGQNRAFATAFDRLVDPGSFLGGVEGSLTDASKRVALYNAGLNENQLGGGSAAVGSRLINQIKRLADQTPDNLLGNVFRARGLDQFISEDDFRRIKRTSGAEISDLQRRFGRSARDYDISGRDQKAYADLTTAISDAGNRIETVFVKGLAPLIPGIEKLSDSVVKAVETLTSAIPKDWAETAGKGIEDLAKYLGTQEFRDGVKNFAEGVVWIGKKIAEIGGWAYGTATSKPVAGTLSAVANSGPSAFAGYSAANIAAHKARGEVLSPYGFWRKANAGEIDPGLGGLASKINAIPGVNRFTSFNDAYHAGTGSAHADGRAFDLTVADPTKSAEVASAIRKVLADQGIKGTVIDEYKNPSSRATAGHIHVQTEVKVMNAAGSNVIVSAQQVTPTP